MKKTHDELLASVFGNNFLDCKIFDLQEKY